MNTFASLAIVATGAFVVLLLAAEHRASPTMRWIAKPLASLGFVTLAIACRAPSSTYGRVILLALVLSFVGDVLLIPKSTTVFRAGVAVFLSAHLAFVAAFVVIGISVTSLSAAAVPVVVVSTIIGAYVLPRVPSDLRGAVGAYVAVISLMLACAASAALHLARPLLFLAALGFYVSDLAVARDKFIAPGFMNRAWGLPLYYAAQLAFAWSVQTAR